MLVRWKATNPQWSKATMWSIKTVVPMCNVWPQNWSCSLKPVLLPCFWEGSLFHTFITWPVVKDRCVLTDVPSKSNAAHPVCWVLYVISRTEKYSPDNYFDQQKFYTTYKYKKDIYFIETTRMLVLSKAHNVSGKVHSPYFCFWWAGEAVVTIGCSGFACMFWA